MSEREARETLWQLGIIAPWYLFDYQFDAYDLCRRARFPFIEKSRRIGKTTGILVHVQEFLRRNPERLWRWCEPWKYQAREIVIPEMDALQASCPDGLKFKYYKTDSFYELPANGSRLYLRGVNEDKGESARGPKADGITADEFGSWKEPKYIVNEVLLPQLLSTDGQLIKASTPPRDLGHLYYDDKELAAREGRLVSKDIWAAENQLYTRKQILDMCEAVGGANSPAWRREFMLEPVSDPDMLICPEFNDTLDGNLVPDDLPRPEFYTPYVGGDSGADDNTALLFGYYDFAKAELVIEEEFVVSGRTTAEIVQSAKRIERELWGELDPRHRVYDAPKQLIYDIFVEHKWPVRMPEKADKEAAIHQFRVHVGQRKFKVKERCRHLRRQLKVGMWKDDRHSDFQRSEGLGHLDAIAAAIYLNRSIDRAHNPIPSLLGVSHQTHFISPEVSSRGSATEDAIASLLGGKR